jgi:nucleoside-triphosphatase THEP1
VKTHIFLTGALQIGKSTAIRRFLADEKIDADGFETFWEGGRGSKGALFMRAFSVPENAGGIAPAKERLTLAVFNTLGVSLVRGSGTQTGTRLTIMDELGFREEGAALFKDAVFERLQREPPVLGVVRDIASPFLDAIRALSNVNVVRVTRENRDEVPRLLAAALPLPTGQT